MKNNIIKKIIGVIISLILIFSSLAITYVTLLYKGLETFYRILIILIIVYFTLLIVFGIIESLKNQKNRKFSILSILGILLIIIYLVISYYLFNVFNKIDDFNKGTNMYSSSLISLNSKYENIDLLKNAKIGMINDEKDIEGYIIPKDIIKLKKLSDVNEIKEYDSIIDLYEAFSKEEIDAIFINSNYDDLFVTFAGYEDISQKIKVIYTEKKEIEVNKEENEDTEETSNKKLTEPFTILLLGTDSTAETLNKNAAFNADSIILVSVNPKTLQATMMSIPRDTLAKITCSGNRYNKINSSGWGGAKCVKNTVQKFTGIDIDFYIQINFKGLVNLVDSLGGVEVDVPYAFCEQDSNRKFGSKMIYVNSGRQTLNGEQALALSRNRKVYSYCGSKYTSGKRNDTVRGQNQQKVIEGIINKAKTITSADQVLEILDVINKSINTNMSSSSMLSAYEVIKDVALGKNANVVNIQHTYLKWSSRLISLNGKNTYGGSVVFHSQGSLDAITDAMKVNLGLKKANMIKEFSFSINKKYEKEIIGEGNYSITYLKLMPNFTSYSSIASIKSKASDLGLTVKIVDNSTGNEITTLPSSYRIIKQNPSKDSIISNVGKNLTIFINDTSTESVSSSEELESTINEESSTETSKQSSTIEQHDEESVTE